MDLTSLILATFMKLSNCDCPLSQLQTKVVYYTKLSFKVKAFCGSGVVTEMRLRRRSVGDLDSANDAKADWMTAQKSQSGARDLGAISTVTSPGRLGGP